MSGPLVVTISIKKGERKPFRGKQTMTERLVQDLDPVAAKAAAMDYFSRIWDLANEKPVSKLKLVKD